MSESKEQQPAWAAPDWQQINSTIFAPNADGLSRFYFNVVSASEALKPGDTERIASMILREHNSHDALVAALKALEPYLSTEAQMLDYASLNEGRASGFDVASIKARKALALAEKES